MSDAEIIPTLQMSNGDLGVFLCGVPVHLDYADGDGSGEVVLEDESAEEFTADEIRQMGGPGKTFWVEHPVTKKQVTVLVQVR